MIVNASDESVTALNAVDQVVVAQKIERAIHRDRCGPSIPTQSLHNLIGAERLVACEQGFEHVTAHRRQPLRARGAQLFCMRDGGARAGVMIVVGCRKNRLSAWSCRSSSGRLSGLAILAPYPVIAKTCRAPDFDVAPQQKASHIAAALRKSHCHNGASRQRAVAQPHQLGIIMLKGKTALVTGSTSGIGLGYARALAAEGVNVTINGFGDAAAIEEERVAHRERFRRPGGLFARRHDQAGRDRRHGAHGREDLRLGRHPHQQCRHPVRVADRGIPDREMGSDHRDQSFGGVPRHSRRRAGHEGAQMGPHHQHSFGALAGRFAVQGRLRVRQTRHCRPHQDGRA